MNSSHAQVIDAKLQPMAAESTSGQVEFKVTLSRAGYDNLLWTCEQLAKMRPELAAELSSPERVMQAMAEIFESRTLVGKQVQMWAGFLSSARQAQQQLAQIQRAGEDLIALGRTVLRKGGRRR